MNDLTFNAAPMEKPEKMPLYARLAWSYFDFNQGGWSATETSSGHIIVTDEGNNLRDAFIFEGEDDFIKWLVETALEHIGDDINISDQFLLGALKVSDEFSDLISGGMLLNMRSELLSRDPYK